ncbi:HlyD family type I secretion periplasmic adaptor subunit [Chelativorans alearense]|uniref:HlyD family type I secretion periplasmic adaptor subunit n=1 Tax=Chelativorans alearense TaxID=2681495 RepID=UPI001FEB0CD8|nr:HlyD family type I secretion periplasmic adaptor subunit [Chelativorans alearense]
MSEMPDTLNLTAAWVETQLSRAIEALQAGYTFLIAVIRDQLALRGMEASEATILAAIGGATLVVVLVFAQLFRSALLHRKATHPDTLRDITRYPRRLGIVAAVLFVSVLGGWSALAPLASAALAPGIISPDGYRKTIQHLEGGIIQAIHVREGETVEVGAPLVTLDDTKAKALDAELRERLLHLLAIEARLEAERTDAAEISFPELFLKDSKGLQQVVQGQQQLFLSRRAAHKGRIQILEARIRQLQEQNAGYHGMLAAEEEQIALVDEEIAAAQHLLDQGLARKPRLLALKRGRADIEATKAANRAKIAENAQAIGETRLQLLTLNEERQEKIGAELADIRRIVAEIKGQLPSREAILERTIIRAPIDGTVMNLRVNTVSGVVGAGQPLLDIVPDGSQLVIDARVRPTDIERIRPGMSARVVLTAYRQRNLQQIHGRLRSVSADAMADERTGSSYFLAKVEVLPEDLASLDKVRLVPGMPAEVMLMDGEQSAFAYLLGPILDSARRSLREN